MRRQVIGALLAAVMLSTAGAAMQAPDSERSHVIAAVQAFFDSMEKADAELAKKVLMPEARFFSAAERDGKMTVRPSTGEAFVASFSNPNRAKALERMWDPDVRVQGAIAQVWTRYDFHSNGTFSHCGIDAFSLVKTDEGWKIANAMWTVERTGCAPSPLAAPK
jgi:opacity protein-like surface antigen